MEMAQATSNTAMETSQSDSAAGESNSRSTHFNFLNVVFGAPGARFCLKGPDHIPVFCVDMGDVEGTLDVKSLQKEFEIEPGSHDDDLVAKAVKGLRYVPDIRPGDEIPSEILDGSASWKIDKKHKLIAVQRLKAQLLSWVSGQEVLITDPDELDNYFGQIENKKKIKEAFSNAAEMLGHDRDDHAVVFDKIDTLSRELCYIEALRDRYKEIPKISERLDGIKSGAGQDKRLIDEVQRINQLLGQGVEEYEKLFEDIDAQTGEIVSAFKAIGRQVDYIRKIRDELHFLVMSWDPIIDKWNETLDDRGRQIQGTMSATYRFLTGKFNTARSMMQR